jgi:hypothetical protein
MKREYVPFCLSIALSICLQGCISIVTDREAIRGSGNISEETYAFTGVTGVQLSTLGELDIHLGDKEELRIEADDNLLQYFETGKDGDVLRIGTRSGVNLRPSEPVRYTLTVREIEFIGLSSTGNAHAPTLAADRFEIRVSSTGDLSVDGIEANALDVRISSTGDVRIGEGVVDSQNLRISSTGDYDGESVRSAQATVRLSSTGSARLWAEESLDATLTSTGSVFYKGDPEVSESHSSTGQVRRIR